MALIVLVVVEAQGKDEFCVGGGVTSPAVDECLLLHFSLLFNVVAAVRGRR